MSEHDAVNHPKHYTDHPSGKVRNDLTGKRFTRLTVVKRVLDDRANVRWECVCDCGNTTIAVSGNLVRGRHKSCGCWRGGPRNYKHKDRVFQNGYAFLLMPDHPRANPHTGRVREHIVVMEQKLGRDLLPGEEVHHLNADRNDNRPENLELWTRSQPAGARVADKVLWAVDLLKLYAPELLK